MLDGWFKKAPAPAGTTAPSAVAEVLAKQLVRSVFQPVVDLTRRTVFAYESLARPQHPEFKGPVELFEAAVREQRVGELGRLLRIQSVDGCTQHPLLLNIHPNEFDQGFLVQPNDPIFWHEEQVYLEITESAPLRYFEQCHSVLRETRGKGVALAIDDLGAGYSNLKYITDLEPSLVKIDRELVAGVREGTRQYVLLRGIVRLCADMGARVVCEGIETVDELRAVIEAGAHFGQGYLLARPAFPPPPAVWPEGL